MDRVALVAFLWFVVWTITGTELGRLMFNTPLGGGIWGFVLALLTVFLWPWVLPRAIDDWMHGSRG